MLFFWPPEFGTSHLQLLVTGPDGPPTFKTWWHKYNIYLHFRVIKGLQRSTDSWKKGSVMLLICLYIWSFQVKCVGEK